MAPLGWLTKIIQGYLIKKPPMPGPVGARSVLPENFPSGSFICDGLFCYVFIFVKRFCWFLLRMQLVIIIIVGWVNSQRHVFFFIDLIRTDHKCLEYSHILPTVCNWSSILLLIAILSTPSILFYFSYLSFF